MESEVFFDSLEEDSDNDNVISSMLKEKQHAFESDDMIPFYDRNLSKSEIELSKKKSSKCSAFLSGRRFAPKPKRCSERSESSGKLKSNSYLNMFYARTGIGNDCWRDAATQSGMEPSNLTSKSYACDIYEVNSFYLKSRENSESSCSDDNHYTLREIPELALCISSPESKYRSMPEPNYEKTPGRKSRSPRTMTTKVPELGKLGPEIPTDKLELLRRRQLYGKKVSQSNRIKMLEKKALQDLDREMKNSRVCL
ncbi:hypothetical protein JTB14_020757 [Gonioctena quinquepunctata]|nr:hypothetical protein JTB14_020757 [Gonioctena quinquepunctata]